jgi:hypothetical protein
VATPRAGAIEIAEPGDRAAELVGSVEQACEAALLVADLDVRQHVAVGVQEENVDGAGSGCRRRRRWFRPRAPRRWGPAPSRSPRYARLPPNSSAASMIAGKLPAVSLTFVNESALPALFKKMM